MVRASVRIRIRVSVRIRIKIRFRIMVCVRTNYFVMKLNSPLHVHATVHVCSREINSRVYF